MNDRGAEVAGPLRGPGSHDETRERAQRGTRQLLVARACVVGFGFLGTAILTRQLGPVAYGIYGVVISQLLWLEMLLNAGVPGATAKLMADGRHDQWVVERSARALLVAWSLLLVAASWALAPWVASLMTSWPLPRIVKSRIGRRT